MKFFSKAGVVAIALSFLGGCQTLTLEDAIQSDYLATVGLMTAQNRALRSIPEPQSRVTVAVYEMPDLTGQYKASDTTQTLSRAVTQGGSAVLIKALQDAGERRWFSVLDRSSLDNLLRERQIITEMRRIYRNEQQINPGVLGPLSHSGIIVEGAILGYDTNTVTGGIGARYLGIGPNQRWKLDIVSVSLRAVSTETSEVLASVVVRKPIASVSNQGSIFTYVALDELLEAEVGRAINEPKQIALEQAVEKAVMALVAEGAQLGIWHFKNRTQGNLFIADYTRQKFDGVVPVLATKTVAPNTRSPAAIPRTVPRPQPRPVRVIQRRVPPTEAAPAPPPDNAPPDDPSSDEVVG